MATLGSRRGRWLIRVAAFIVAYLFLSQGFLSEGLHPHWRALQALVWRGVVTTGRVTAKEPMNHQNIRYVFDVGASQHAGSGPAGKGGIAEFARITVGDFIPVTYVRDEPWISWPGNPQEEFYELSVLLFVLLPAGCLLLAWLAPRALQGFRDRPSESGLRKLWRTLTRR